MSDFDYIVVGGGSAGCALAGRLCQDGRTRVLLLEAGPPPDSPWIRVPAGLPKVLASGRYSWVTPSQVVDRPTHPTAQGRTLGGGSSINGMLYMRGYPGNYNSWAQFGVRGWNWDEVLAAFRSVERHAGGESEIHGGAGPLHVTPLAYRHRSTAAFIAAAGALGARVTEDLNDTVEADSVGAVQLTIGQGRRCSAYEAFLRPALGRANLKVETEALVRRVTFEGRRATGVEYERGGEVRQVRAGHVVVSGGAINSPQVLLLSGIGPAEELRRVGVDVVHDLPGVGRNFHDHAYSNLIPTVRRESSMNRTLEGVPVALQALRYAVTRGGPLATGGSQAAAMLRSSPDLEVPDLQVSFRPFTVRMNGRKRMAPEPGNSVTLMPTLDQPAARGAITLTSPDPRARPRVDYNMLGDPRDEDRLLMAMKWSMRLLRTAPMAQYVLGPSEPALEAGDDEIRRYLRDTCFPGAHCAGSCAMGGGPNAVVDDHLSVHGVEGLSVCDASVMPVVISGNTNGPSIMIGARGAELIPRRRRATGA